MTPAKWSLGTGTAAIGRRHTGFPHIVPELRTKVEDRLAEERGPGKLGMDNNNLCLSRLLGRLSECIYSKCLINVERTQCTYSKCFMLVTARIGGRPELLQ